MTVKKALSSSRNTCTVRVAIKTGIDEIIKTARLLGINGDIDRNFSIVLGSPGFSPLDMATVYTTFARDGSYIKPIAIRQIKTSKGDILMNSNRNSMQVVKSDYVRELNDVLIDVVQKGTGMSAKLNDRIVAGKTGTTDKVRDIWFTGYTPDTVTTIWIGNDEYKPLRGLFSSNCAHLWKNFSQEYYKTKKIPPSFFAYPDRSVIAAVKEDKPAKLEDTPKSLPKKTYRKKRYKRKKVNVVKKEVPKQEFEGTVPASEPLVLRGKKEIPQDPQLNIEGN